MKFEKVIEFVGGTEYGSATVYDVDFSRDRARELLYIPYNNRAVTGSGVFRSQEDALAFARARYPTAEVGTVPPDFDLTEVEYKVISVRDEMVPGEVLGGVLNQACRNDGWRIVAAFGIAVGGKITTTAILER